MSRSTKIYIFGGGHLFMYFVLTYVHVSRLLLSSENVYSTRLC